MKKYFFLVSVVLASCSKVDLHPISLPQAASATIGGGGGNPQTLSLYKEWSAYVSATRDGAAVTSDLLPNTTYYLHIKPDLNSSPPAIYAWQIPAGSGWTRGGYGAPNGVDTDSYYGYEGVMEFLTDNASTPSITASFTIKASVSPNMVTESKTFLF